MIKEITIEGLRGFEAERVVKFSIPDNVNEGSGYNVIVGPNNSGKTTIIEAIKAFNGYDSPTFSIGKRNKRSSSKIKLTLTDSSNTKYEIKTVNSGGSSTVYSEKISKKYFVLPSRRHFNFEFGKATTDRDQYISQQLSNVNSRGAQLDSFYIRLFKILDNKEAFDQLLHEIIGESIEWTIDQNDSGSYYVKYSYGDLDHSSEGLGDGLWSAFTICDALYDSRDGDVIVIDEPELSIHPAIQKRLLEVFCKQSKTKQIIVCTHSPYFIDWKLISNGGMLSRTVKKNNHGVCVYMLTSEFRDKLNSFLKDINNPHTLGFESKEAFFLKDNVILVEGQEDVVIYRKIQEQLGLNLTGDFFGWGVGGAEKMEFFIKLFLDLGYDKLAIILDGDKKELFDELKKLYLDFSFYILPLQDVRDKKAITINCKLGITNSGGILKEDYKEFIEETYQNINSYFNE